MWDTDVGFLSHCRCRVVLAYDPLSGWIHVSLSASYICSGRQMVEHKILGIGLINYSLKIQSPESFLVTSTEVLICSPNIIWTYILWGLLPRSNDTFVHCTPGLDLDPVFLFYIFWCTSSGSFCFHNWYSVSIVSKHQTEMTHLEPSRILLIGKMKDLRNSFYCWENWSFLERLSGREVFWVIIYVKILSYCPHIWLFLLYIIQGSVIVKTWKTRDLLLCQ